MRSNNFNYKIVNQQENKNTRRNENKFEAFNIYFQLILQRKTHIELIRESSDEESLHAYKLDVRIRKTDANTRIVERKCGVV